MAAVVWQKPMRVANTLAGLPSGESAEALVNGDFSAIPVMVFHTAMRAALVGVGMYLVGLRGPNLVKYSLAGAASIEAFVLAWALYENGKKKP